MKVFRNAIFLFVFGLLMPNLASAQPVLRIAPDSSLFHHPLQISATQLPSNEQLEFHLEAIDADSNRWVSKAIYTTSEEGSVDLATHASLGGSYEGVHPMGLFWSMKSEDTHQMSTHKGYNATLSIKQGDKVFLQKSFYRSTPRNLNRYNIAAFQKRDSIIANVYYPASTEKLPAIIFIGGSGGGFRQERSALFASEGFAVLNLKYFKYEGLPDGIIEIPLEYVHKAYQWLIQQPQIDPNKIGIIGRSRGSELAMLYAAHYDGLRFVIAEAPSNVVWFGWADHKSSWTYQGHPFPYAEYTDEASTRIEMEMQAKGIQYHDGPKFLSAFDNEAMIASTEIPVEQTKCPILLISGEEDKVWPATMMANRIIKRLEQHQFSFDYQHRSYKNAGHNFAGGRQGCGIPYLPPEDYSKGSAKGGSDEGNSMAAIQSWEEELGFIKKHFKQDQD